MYSQEKGAQEKYRAAFGRREEQHANKRTNALAVEEMAELREMIQMLKASVKERKHETDSVRRAATLQINLLARENFDLRTASKPQRREENITSPQSATSLISNCDEKRLTTMSPTSPLKVEQENDVVSL